jgi:hypothetical protein
MMDTASTSETSVNFYQTARRNIPEVSHLHTRHHENLKSHLGTFLFSASVVSILEIRQKDNQSSI